MDWSDEFLRWRAGIDCPMCDGRPDETEHGVRFFTGRVSDAYLVRADVQPGMSVVIWRGRHVVEPTELTHAEAAAYGAEVLRVARSIEAVMRPLKMNYNVLGNSVPHLHTHLVPRYTTDPRPGWPFPFPDPTPPPMPADRLRRQADALRAALTDPG